MKWFKHHSDTHTNMKAGAVLAEHGVSAYGFWWLCVELVAQQGEQYCLGADKNWKRWLIKESGLDTETVEKYLAFFADERLISFEGLQEAQLYIPQLSEYCDDYESRRERKSSDTVRTKSEKVPLEEKRIEKNRKEELVQLFSKIWEEYPKKVSKAQALSAFLKLSPSEELTQEILSSIAAHKRTSQWKENEGRYIPHFSTFLNQKRFEDEVKEEATGKAIKL